MDDLDGFQASSRGETWLREDQSLLYYPQNGTLVAFKAAISPPRENLSTYFRNVENPTIRVELRGKACSAVLSPLSKVYPT